MADHTCGAPSADSTERFTSRVDDYVRARPGYPREVVNALVATVGLRPASVVADIGAGTGISSELFLRVGFTVHAVEPNEAMRRAAETRFRGVAGFHSVNGTAERTTLADRSVDLVFAAQAFHWFDAPSAATEFRRILRPGGMVALVWNTRRDDSTPFLRGYEAMLRTFSDDYRAVDHRRIDAAALRSFFGGPFETRRFDNAQQLDLEGLTRRLLSSSYAPAPGHAAHEPMMAELRRLFESHARNGAVTIEYDTELSVGALANPRS
ncbi:MAG: class I SAM-dependent methyltransferase [Phycisphaerales bacterium]|nr:class I SAM-dependent methyltransferase [Phycisphaerales bacterium]